MAKVSVLGLALLLLAAAASDCQAGIRMITDAPRYSVRDKLPRAVSAQEQARSRCRQLGYTKTTCNSGYKLADPCPYDGQYYANCCDKSYRYSKEDCYAKGMIPSGRCGGHYACEEP